MPRRTAEDDAIYPRDAGGMPVNWAPGAYTITLTAKDADTGKSAR